MNRRDTFNLFLLFFLLINIGYAQVGIGTTTPTPGAILDIVSTDKGILVPRADITDLSTIAPVTGGAPTGLLVWNTNTTTGTGFHFWDGTNWVNFITMLPDVDNGLNYNTGADHIRLGGDLVEDTTIRQGSYDLTYNLNGTGDFNIQDNGTTRFQVLDNGRVEMPNNIDASGAGNTGALEIANSLRLDGNEIITNTNSVLFLNNDNNGDVRIDGNTLQVDASVNRVGIRTTTPDHELDVAGNIGHNSYMYHNGDDDTFWRFPNNDEIIIQAGGRRMVDFIEGADDYAVFNEAGVDIDFRVKSDNQANQFFIDGGNDRIGIRTNAPTSFFEMTNGGENVGANSMARFTNESDEGLALTAFKSSTTNAYSGFEAAVNYGGIASAVAIFGLALNTTPTSRAIGVRGSTNSRDGIGVMGDRNGSTGGLGFGGLFLNDLGYTGMFLTVSDRKTKSNIKEINKALDIVDKLNPVSYKFNHEKYPNMGLNMEKEYGFVAQEVRDILPEITSVKELRVNAPIVSKASQEAVEGETEPFVMLDYTRLIPILTKAIKEQQTVIKNQNTRLKVLEAKIEALLHKN